MSTHRVTVILSGAEFEAVKAKAGAVPLSAWFRALAIGGKKPAKEAVRVEAIRASDPMAAERPEIEYGSEELPSGGSIFNSPPRPNTAWRRVPRQKGDKSR